MLWNAGINMHTQLSLDLHVGPKTVNETREKRGEIKFFFVKIPFFLICCVRPMGLALNMLGSVEP